MEFELNRLPRGVSIEEIKDEIKRVADLISDTIIPRREFDKLSKISTSALCRRFGSWENVLKSCGLEHRYYGLAISEKMKNQTAKKLSNIELIEELKRVAKQIGKNKLSQPEFNENSEVSASVIVRRFRSWSKGLKLAGLDEVKMGKRYTELEYFENLLTVWTHYGRQPFYREMNIPPSKISSGGYEARFGKWSFALRAFVEYINSDKPNVEQEKIEVQIIDKKKTVTSEERRGIPLGLRYKVLSRDRFKCVKCGNSPSADINCKLHIDHIIPFSKGGLTTFENLQTLCDSCNLGKGDRYIE